MTDGNDFRRELDGYARRHEGDQFAHSAMRHDLREEFVGEGNALDKRLTDVERWQQRMIGGMMFAGLLVGSGFITAVIELTRRT